MGDLVHVDAFGRSYAYQECFRGYEPPLHKWHNDAYSILKHIKGGK